MRREKEASLPFFSFVSGCKGRERERSGGEKESTHANKSRRRTEIHQKDRKERKEGNAKVDKKENFCISSMFSSIIGESRTFSPSRAHLGLAPRGDSYGTRAEEECICGTTQGGRESGERALRAHPSKSPSLPPSSIKVPPLSPRPNKSKVGSVWGGGGANFLPVLLLLLPSHIK